MSWRYLLLVLATGGLLVPACSGEPSQADLTAADVVVVADGTRFVDPPSDLPAGEITLGLDNQGGGKHDLTIEGVGTVVETGGGGKALGEVTLEPGVYTVYCDVGGHREAGMEFQTTVS